MAELDNARQEVGRLMHGLTTATANLHHAQDAGLTALQQQAERSVDNWTNRLNAASERVRMLEADAATSGQDADGS